MKRRVEALLDSSVWIPYLRARTYAATVDALISRGRVWLHSVVLLELYAGAANPGDRRDVDAIRIAAERLGRIVHPSVQELCLAGRVLSGHEVRYGRLRCATTAMTS